MRLLTILLTFTSLQAAAHSYGQVSLSVKDEPLEKVLVALKKQSGYEFFYNENMMRNAQPVTLTVKGRTLEQVLELCFNNQPRLGYVIISRTVVIKDKALTNPLPTEEALPPPPIEVKGRVVDENGQPVAGASVQVKGTTNGTSTDANGNFTLSNVDDKATLVITSVNIEPMEVKLNGRSSLTISAKTAVKEEEIVMAYGTRTKTNNVAAVTVVKGEQIQSLPNRSFDKSLQGLVPGLLVTSGTGQPGSGVGNFVLRGIATSANLENGSTARNPLVVIDGMPVSQDYFQLYVSNTSTPITNPLSQLNPSDIETITVLKDAAAIALYGARASNGVIVVTTKRGKSGKTMFSFRHQTDIATRLNGREQVLSQKEYLELLYEGYKNSNPTLWTDDAILQDLKSKYPTRADGSFYPTQNWASELYNRNAITVSNELAISGGNETNSFYFNFEYSKQHGIIKETGYDRISFRFNFENRPASWLKIGLNTGLSYNIQNYGGALRGLGDGTSLSVMSPLNPIRLEDGNYKLNFNRGTVSTQANPVAASEYNINRNSSYRGLGKIYGEVTFLKNFKFTSNVGFDFMMAEAKEKFDPRLYDPSTRSIGGRIEEQDIRRANFVTTNILRFDRMINSIHSLNIIVGQEAQILNQKALLAAVKGLSLPYYDQISSPGVTIYKYMGYTTKENLLSYFAQTNYTFRNKYFLSASVRRDGSSRFGEDRRYGTYWSTGAGWEITSEEFMKRAKWLNYMKIRSSIGAAGNAAAINALSRYDQLYYSTFLGQPAVYSDIKPGNPDIQWEQTFTWDLGIETRFFNDRLNITADIYKRNTSNLLYEIDLPQSSGYYRILDNIGKIENKGFELSLSALLIQSKSFRWHLNANWSTNKNTLIKADVPVESFSTGELANREGENFNSFYLKRWAGVNPADGMPMWIDSTGKPSSDYDASKYEFVGKPQPDGFGAITNTFSYKEIELLVMLYYQYGYQIYNVNDFMLLNDGTYIEYNQDRRALDRWQKPGDIASNPIRLLNNSTGSTYNSTRYLFDGDHLRLQTVSVTYNLKKSITDRMRLSTMKLFVQGHNLAVLTKFPGRDPSNVDIGGTASTFVYPNQRSFSFGLKVGF